MRITSLMQARFYRDRARLSISSKINSSKVNKVGNKSTNNLTISNLNKKLYQISSNSLMSSNRIIDGKVSIQNYINKAKSANERLIKNPGEKITSENSYVSESDVAYQALQDKYSKLLKEAESHTNPKSYIYDKYCNKLSAYYVSDLTDEERRIAYSNEISMMNYGHTNDVNMKDSLFRGITINKENEAENKKIFNVQVINSQINNLLKENSIDVPKSTKLTFSISSKDYKLTVDGTEDDKLKEKLEDVLNSNNNSKELYKHILSISSQSGKSLSDEAVSINYSDNKLEDSFENSKDKNSKAGKNTFNTLP
ncbi:DUF4885 family protein [Clostridium sp. 19966]|uniref:DUF4885 family protein n=1 Tax=Clostridium sp. 19966 TaxID=2768166 RepID=UPI0028DEA5AC|nr:DUF4885 family protein [Clostridium sp. 19966]MDT8719232.1 DUF4885 family protein [Clostridium sp. 19966]